MNDSAVAAFVARVRDDPARTAVAAVVLAATYVLLGRLTFSVSVEHSNVTSVVFAPEGIALAFAILFGPRVAWGVFAGQMILSIWSGPSVLGGAAIGAVNSLECVLGAVLFAHWRISRRFERPRDVALFVTLVFLVLQPISATGGVAVLWALGAIPADAIPASWEPWWIQGIQKPLPSFDLVPSAWIHWWIGNSVGQILIAPLILAWTTAGISRRPDNRSDLAASAIAIGAIGMLAIALPIHPLLMLGVTYPLLVWIGLRRGLRGVTTANVLITPAVIWAGASGRGFLSHLSVADRLTYVGFFVATACVFSLMLFAMFEERRLLVARLEQLARQDPLVPLANRRYFVERLEQQLAHAAHSGQTLAAVIFDIDHFKQINDEYGHAAGDLVLITIAETCAGLVRDSDLAARIGGEEFAIVLPETTVEEAGRFADRLRAAVANQHRKEDQPGTVAITISAGVAVVRPGDNVDAVLGRADNALYQAKRGGRDRVVTAT